MKTIGTGAGVLLLGMCIACSAIAAPFTIQGASYESKAAFVETGRRCATDEPSEYQLQRIDQKIQLFRSQNAEFRKIGGVIMIPIQFHILHSGDVGNVSDADLDSQVSVLNRAYKPHGVQFERADVTRTDNARWFKMGYKSPAEREAKAELGKDPARNLNFYTAGLEGGLLGWATFPADFAGDPTRDGVVVLHSSLPGGASKPFDLGMTAVHEVGHWLGLFHTFQGGCSAPGDEVDDTPFEADAAVSCPPMSQDTCPSATGTDPVRNYMNYVDDSCMTEFTSLQKQRMRDHLGAFRPALLAGELKQAVVRISVE